MPSFGGTYNTGTVTLTNGDATAVFTGSLLSTQATEGDLLFFPTLGLLAYVSVVTDDTHIEMSANWALSTQTDIAYLLLKTSWTRYDPAATQQKTRDMLSYFEAAGFFYFVSGSAPDVGLGSDGQWALKVNDGSWQVWYHTGGVWVLQGTPVGFIWMGAYSAVTTYGLNHVVSSGGNSYVSIQANNVGHDPASSPTYWDIFTVGGSRFDLLVWDNGQAISGEVLIRAPISTSLQFPANLVGSQAKTEVAATSSAVYSIRKNNVEFATCTFAPAATTGTFAGTLTNFVAGDVLTVVAPNPQDATLSSTSLTLTAYR